MKPIAPVLAAGLLSSGIIGPVFAGNLDRVQALYGAFGAGDIPTVLSALSDDVAWDHGYEGTSIPTLTPRTGPAEVAGFFQALAAIDFRKLDILNMMEGGNQVAVLIDVELVDKDSGASFADNELHLWTFGENGEVVAFRHFLDMEEYGAMLAAE